MTGTSRDRTGWPRKDGQLRTHPNRQGPQRNQAPGHGLVHAAQVPHQNARSVQMESTLECARRTTRTWHALLGHLCPGSDMANHQVLPDTVHPPWMAQSPIRFCHGIPASAG